MGIFESIKQAIFGHGEAAGAVPAGGASAAASSAGGPAPAAGAPGVAGVTAPEAQLSALAARNPQPLNWKTSIVDLMKLVGLDPSLANRKQLAQELGYGGDTADSAAMNVWLHQEVMAKLAREGVVGIRGALAKG
jgi:hypothetical protein